MSTFIAALPMYDWPEARAQTDAEWARLRGLIRKAGIEAPTKLARRNADLPPVPGGIRDGEGRPVAPDPATLPPDEFDFQTLWKHPELLLAQTCWGPMEQGLASHVTVVGQPSYDGVEGGEGIGYSSAILMRRSSPSPLRGGSARSAGVGLAKNRALHLDPHSARSTPPLKEEGVAAPADGQPVLPLGLIRDKRFAYNDPDSMSGIIAITHDLEAVGQNLNVFSEHIETGAHRASIVAVAAGLADVCAIDCLSWKMAQSHEPRAADLRVVGWTGRRKGLPMITSLRTPPEVLAALRDILRLR